MSYRINVKMTSNEKIINFDEQLMSRRMKISMVRYQTGSAGNRTMYIILEKFATHPSKENGLPFSAYTKILPLYSSTGTDFLFISDNTFDEELRDPQKFAQLKIQALINADFGNTDISPANPLELELLFELEGAKNNDAKCATCGINGCCMQNNRIA